MGKQILAGLSLLCLALGMPRSSAQSPGRISTRREGPRITISWASVAGRRYELDSTTNLASPWQAVATEPNQLVASGNQLSYIVSIENRAQFYRVAELAEPPEGFWLSVVSPGGTQVIAGQPVQIEVRASHNAPLAGVAFLLAATCPDGSSAGMVRTHSPGACPPCPW
ncbi:MAG: hypothetical protein M1608_00335, partial [Candidatus Omnitrophica bacterium]|nr:hypothetical protein [Candidatus Omnitrophota bacterium]